MSGTADALKNEDVRRMLEAGLDSFATGDFVSAQKTWKKVFEIDPGNELAMDYIRSTEDEIPPEDKKALSEELLQEAISLLGKNQPETAYELLEIISIDKPDDERVRRFLDTTRGTLLKDYDGEVGDTNKVIRLKKDMREIMKLNLTRESAYIVSIIDGDSTIEELSMLSGIDRFLFMRNVVLLLRNDIIIFVNPRR